MEPDSVLPGTKKGSSQGFPIGTAIGEHFFSKSVDQTQVSFAVILFTSPLRNVIRNIL